jgi:hypothetical protein
MASQDESAERADRELMDRYGIVRVPADYFMYRGYRYSNLKDAVAQVERDRAAGAKG